MGKDILRFTYSAETDKPLIENVMSGSQVTGEEGLPKISDSEPSDNSDDGTASAKFKPRVDYDSKMGVKNKEMDLIRVKNDCLPTIKANTGRGLRRLNSGRDRRRISCRKGGGRIK